MGNGEQDDFNGKGLVVAMLVGAITLVVCLICANGDKFAQQ